MGKTLKNLSTKEISPKAIFDQRFVVECCEAMHVHYRNLRLLLSVADWVEMAQGMTDALKRWRDQDAPAPMNGRHIELCRKQIATEPLGGNEIKVNLNENLYPKHDGRIFAEGAGFNEKSYVHVKIRDIRIELSLSEFHELAEACKEAIFTLNGAESCQR